MSKLKPIVVGSSHQTASLEQLQFLAFSPEEIKKTLPFLRESFDLHEVTLVSTCNRTEVYGLTENPNEAAKHLGIWLLNRCSNTSDMKEENFYHHEGRQAVEHLLRVTSGLESLVLGETQITGQTQNALAIAREAGTAGSFSVQLFSCAFKAAKQARSKTSIDKGNTSVASASVLLARRILGKLDKCTALVVGAGETGQLLTKYLNEYSTKKIYIANRTKNNAQKLANDVGGEALGLDEIESVLPTIDIIICATHSAKHIISAHMAEEAFGSRDRDLVVMVDISLPHNIDPAAGELPNVFLNDMNDLEIIVEQSLAKRAREIPMVEKILQQEIDEFYAKQSILSVGPLIKELRGRFEELKNQELQKYESSFTKEDFTKVEKLTQGLINKLLHWPTLEIRDFTSSPSLYPEKISWTRRVFGLDKNNEQRKGKKK